MSTKNILGIFEINPNFGNKTSSTDFDEMCVKNEPWCLL